MADSDNQLILPIIDSHVHIWPSSATDSHTWMTPDNPLRSAHSVEQYREATKTAPSLLGFLFVEVDRKHDSETAWDPQLDELAFVSRVATGQPRDAAADGHTPEDAALCLGMIPWAPLPLGVEAMEKYLDRVKEVAGDAWPKIKGFRYLLQDKPDGTGTKDDFIEGLKLLGRRGFVFDVCIDNHRRGKKQLEDVLAMMQRAHEGVPDEEKVTFVIDHLGKPDLTLYNTSSDPSFISWRDHISLFSKLPKTYIKISGAFPEMSPSLAHSDPSQVFQSLFSWLAIVLATFGPSRIMFGSDWPVCEAATPDAWPRWKEVVDKTCWMASLSDEDRAMIYGGTTKKAYGL
ncbi:hypothetical protein B0I35DRAFT_474699 [Stachybotrys elegans]|uniref:Amidohydrolase-related domain-containing protein n=1 Tax=Stachybotrys elegans TaxID=80388 RepID=A0A8K0T132_9HYPO|nr:hypothetical protein B0I35DRAFT_474699 [Stachybotrys elegans]